MTPALAALPAAMKKYSTQAKLIGIYFYILREGFKNKRNFFRQPSPRKKSNVLLAKKNNAVIRQKFDKRLSQNLRRIHYVY